MLGTNFAGRSKVNSPDDDLLGAVWLHQETITEINKHSIRIEWRSSSLDARKTMSKFNFFFLGRWVPLQPDIRPCVSYENYTKTNVVARHLIVIHKHSFRLGWHFVHIPRTNCPLFVSINRWQCRRMTGHLCKLIHMAQGHIEADCVALFLSPQISSFSL